MVLALYNALARQRWIAKAPTNLKRKLESASSLPEDQKFAVAQGDVLVAVPVATEAGHFRLNNVSLNGSKFEGVWFAYAEHFEIAQ